MKIRSVKIAVAAFILFFAIPASSALAACYYASGFGTSAINGTYTDTGLTNDGEPVYYNNLYYLDYYIAAGNTWVFDATNPPAGGVYYYNGSTSITGGTWTAQDGTNPGGTVVSTTCPAASSTPEATSTPEQTQSNLFYGILIFLLAFFGTIWIIRSH